MPELPSVTDVVRNFSDYINRVVYRGERFVLTRGGKVVAELRPVTEEGMLRELSEVVSELPHLSRHELDRLADDLAATREGGESEEGGPRRGDAGRGNGSGSGSADATERVDPARREAWVP